MNVVRSLSIILLAALIACGGSGNQSGNQPPQQIMQNPPSMTGSYQITATPQSGPNTYVIAGHMQSDVSGAITASLYVDGQATSCFDFSIPIGFTGAVDAQGRMSVTSASYNGQVIKLNGSVSADGKSISAGSYTITGGCAAGDQGSAAGFVVQNITGMYNGSIIAGGTTINISVSLAQNPTNPLLLSGSATFTNGAACSLSSAGIVSGETGFAVAGDIHFVMMQGIANPVIGFHGLATDGTAKTIQGTFSLSSGSSCSGATGPLSLTLQ